MYSLNRSLLLFHIVSCVAASSQDIKLHNLSCQYRFSGFRIGPSDGPSRFAPQSVRGLLEVILAAHPSRERTAQSPRALHLVRKNAQIRMKYRTPCLDAAGDSTNLSHHRKSEVTEHDQTLFPFQIATRPQLHGLHLLHDQARGLLGTLVEVPGSTRVSKGYTPWVCRRRRTAFSTLQVYT